MLYVSVMIPLFLKKARENEKKLALSGETFYCRGIKEKKGYPYVPIFKSDTGRIVDFIRGRV